MQSVSYRSERSAGVLRQAEKSVFIAAPTIDESLVERLFALSNPIDVDLMISRDALADSDRRLRDNIKRLKDINLDIDVRVADETFPSFTVVDGKHVHCFSEQSKLLATGRPEQMVEAARALWARSQSIVPPHPSRMYPA